MGEHQFPQNTQNPQTFLLKYPPTDVQRYRSQLPCVPCIPWEPLLIRLIRVKFLRTLTSVQSEICGRKEIPTERTELTEPLAEKSLPQMAQMFTDVGRHTKFVLFEFAPPHQYHAFFSNTNLSYLTNAYLVMRRQDTSATIKSVQSVQSVVENPKQQEPVQSV